MKTGIVTWFKHQNYGTVLQAYALQKYIKENFGECELINYMPPKAIKDKIKIKNIIRKLKELTDKKGHDEIEYEKSKKKKFTEFIQDNISLSKEKIRNIKELNNYYDIFICGSDQIWNKYNKYYYLKFVKDNKLKASYAPSFGRSEIGEDNKKRKQAILRLNCISTREDEGKEIIKKMTGKDVEVVVDPTLLLEKEEWSKMASENIVDGEYIICYLLGNKKENIENCYKIAKVLNKKIYFIPINYEQYKSKDYLQTAIGPSEFLGLVKNASFVCTDSFHGLIFSIIFQKQYICLKRFNDNDKISQNSRIYSISKKLNLEDRILNDKNMIDELVKSKIEYGQVTEYKEKYVKKSKEYIKTIFEKYKEKKKNNEQEERTS